MAYERTTWVPKNTDGSVPAGAPAINAQKLNNIEDGIEEALEGIRVLESDLKAYADNNILYFSGSANFTKGVWTDIFQLPDTIDLTKYIVLVQGVNVGNYDSLKVVPIDTETQLYYESWKYVKIHISSDTKIVSYRHDGSNSGTFKIILLPVSKPNMTSLT